MPPAHRRALRRPFEHVHQCALADIQAEQVAKYALQRLVRKILIGFKVQSQSMDAAAKWCALAAEGTGALVALSHCVQRQAILRCRRTNGFILGRWSIS